MKKYYEQDSFKIIWELNSYKCFITGNMIDKTNIHIEGPNSVKISTEGLNKIVNDEVSIDNNLFNSDDFIETFESIEELILARHIFKDVFVKIPDYFEKQISKNTKIMGIMTSEEIYDVKEFYSIFSDMKDNKKYNKKDHSCFYCQSNDNLIEHREEDKDFICQSCLDKLDHSFKNIISINSIID